MKKRTRLSASQRKKIILETAVHLSEEVGFTNITSSLIADRAEIRHSLIYHYFSSMAELKKEVIKYAVKDDRLSLIAQGLLSNDPIALKNTPKRIKNLIGRF